MCGISGIIGKGWTSKQLDAMVDIQHHRGPDGRGTYISETQTVGLGHNRLSIIDLSSAGHQPMANQDGTVWIVFNGEIYNYRELRAEIGDYPYRSQSDTEVILAAYERWDEQCIEHFNGMFAFAIWNERHHRLFCARDRLGIKPFFYALLGEKFIFASEIKAILAAGYPPEHDESNWATYLTYGLYEHNETTFFRGIKSLPPAHTLTLESEKLKLQCFWDLPSLTTEPLEMNDRETALQLTDLLDDAVRLRLRSDVPLGVNLSGGLDSASLMITVDKLLKAEGEVQTFTASFADPNYDEQEFASQVSRHTQWIRQIQRLNKDDVWDLSTKALWHQEAPYGGIATLAYHKLHHLAQECGVTVLLEGQGVDEMMAGYNYFRPYYLLDLLEQKNWHALRQEIRGWNLRGNSDLDIIRRLRIGSEVNLYQDGSSFLRPMCVLPGVRAQAGEMPDFPRPFQDHLTNVLYRDLRYTKLPRVLRMNDRLSMAFGRELREPYLDHRIVEFLFRLPGHHKIRMGTNKFLLRNAMENRLPDSIRLAEKRGVVTPQREWLRTYLRPLVEEIIYSRSFIERGLFDVPEVHKTYHQFSQGEGQNSFFVWQWVNTEMWYRQYIDA